jgi:hypothetical protein
VVGGLFDQLIDEVAGFVDVMQGAVSKTPNRRVIFFSGNIIVSLVQQLLGAMESARAVHSSVDRGMVVQVFAIVDCRTLDLIDRSVDFVDGVFFFLVHVMRGGKVFQMRPRMPQIGKRMQIGRMPAGFVSQGHGYEERNNEYEQSAMACSFHGFLVASWGE